MTRKSVFHAICSSEFQLFFNQFLKLLKPRYVLSELRDSWLHKYKNFCLKELRLRKTDEDIYFATNHSLEGQFFV